MNFIDLVNKIDRPIVVTSTTFKLEFMNTMACQEFHIHDNRYEGRPFLELITLREKDLELIASVINDDRSVKIPVFIGLEKGGHEVVEKHMICRKLTNSLSKEDLLFFEIESTIHSLIGIDKFQDLGRLTGDLAHALSNPLAVIQINCDSLDIECKKAETIKTEAVQTKVTRIATALDRVGEENQKLKDLSRQLTSGDYESINALVAKPDTEQNH